MTVTDLSGGSKEMGAFFDDNHDGIKDPGEDVMLGFASPFSLANYYYSTAGASGRRITRTRAPTERTRPATDYDSWGPDSSSAHR